MANAFQHFLITRFNLRNENWDNFTKNKAAILTNEWLEDRFNLFETFCLPSVENQSNQNFEWWIYFDIHTPDNFKEKIQQIFQDSNIVRPFFIDGMKAYLPDIQKRLSQHTAEYVITSRLDNDDCLHKDYIQFIQQQFQGQDYLAVDIIDGYTLQTQPNVQLGLKKHLYNPFISVIEKNQGAKSVWDRNHGDWKKEKRLKRIQSNRLWMSVIHDNNKVNEYTGFGKPDFTSTLQLFSVDDSVIKELETLLKFNFLESIKNQVITFFEVGFKDLKKALGKYN